MGSLDKNVAITPHRINGGNCGVMPSDRLNF
jgi:hypothetical protein